MHSSALMFVLFGLAAAVTIARYRATSTAGVCPQCEYPLQDAMTKCPECGMGQEDRSRIAARRAIVRRYLTRVLIVLLICVAVNAAYLLRAFRFLPTHILLRLTPISETGVVDSLIGREVGARLSSKDIDPTILDTYNALCTREYFEHIRIQRTTPESSMQPLLPGPLSMIGSCSSAVYVVEFTVNDALVASGIGGWHRVHQSPAYPALHKIVFPTTAQSGTLSFCVELYRYDVPPSVFEPLWLAGDLQKLPRVEIFSDCKIIELRTE
jgi:hypothetical protein